MVVAGGADRADADDHDDLFILDLGPKARVPGRMRRRSRPDGPTGPSDPSTPIRADGCDTTSAGALGICVLVY
jgi:hypothetical protein